MSQISQHSFCTSSLSVFNLTEEQIEQWRGFMRAKNVPDDLATVQIEIIRHKGFELTGLTEAQQKLPLREYLGRGLESLLVLPGNTELNSILAQKTTSLVSSAFHPSPSVSSDNWPSTVWANSFRKVMAGNSHFVETDPGMEGYIGVFDTYIVYLARKDPAQTLELDEVSGAPLVAIHGLYHYLLEPDIYYGVRFAVDPELQGQGIGRKIMSHNLQQCLRLGATERRIFTEADPIQNKKVLEIYRNWGFTPTGRRIEYKGVEQIFLAAKLEPGTQAWKMAMMFEDEDGPPVTVMQNAR